MKTLLKKYIVILAGVFSLTQIVDAVKIDRGWPGILYVSFIYAALYYLGRPLANLIMLPINILTMNLFSWFINISIFYLWTVINNDVHITDWSFPGMNFGPIELSAYNFVYWQIIFISGILLTAIIIFYNWLIK